MTIYEIKRRTAETSPYYFARDTMRFFGQTMKCFRVHKCEDGRYQISAPVYFKESIVNTSVRFFNPENNKLENE